MTVDDTGAATTTQLRRTPLYEEHLKLGARMVPFSGWEMPVQYGSILQEHEAVRTRAGLFDVSHMGEFRIDGENALALLQYLVPNDVSKLTIGQALYAQLCRPDGNTIDDLLIYRTGETDYMMVVNAGNIDKDFNWVEQQAGHFQNVRVTNISDATALLALQGPLALEILQPLANVDLATIRYYHFARGAVGGIPCLISRTGYTGEDGFELYCNAGDASTLWNKLLDAGKPRGLLPSGLGARDTLRLEAGMCLYGHELDEQTNPLEAGLGWSVKLNASDFIGRDPLLKVKEEGPQRKLIGIVMDERGIPRGGYTLYDADGQRIGELTSGTRGPTVQKDIGMGYVDAAHAVVGQPVFVDIRGKKTAAHIVTLPFYKRKKS